jgi:hypothetical protein
MALVTIATHPRAMSQYQVDIFLIKTMDYWALEGPNISPDEIEIHMSGLSSLKVFILSQCVCIYQKESIAIAAAIWQSVLAYCFWTYHLICTGLGVLQFLLDIVTADTLTKRAT